VDGASEFAFLGLRLTDGIDLDNYRKRFGIDLCRKYAAELENLKCAGLISISNGRLALTDRGRLYSNEVFSIFV
jgi:oxygen-independent coproporphyrinogen-3 oxidase